MNEYPDVFPKDLHGFPPKHKIESIIDLIPRTYLISLTPYQVATTELRELKVQLQKLIDKGFIQLSTSLWEAPIFFCEEEGW